MLYASAGEGGFQHIALIRGMDVRNTYFSESGIVVESEATVAWETMFRLFLTATPERVPRTALKAASHCGGIRPDGNHALITPFQECPGSGEPGNHAYGALCRHLIDIYNAQENVQPDLRDRVPPIMATGRDRFIGMTNEETFGDFVEAALGAADGALAVQEYLNGNLAHWKRSFGDLVGAGCGVGDMVTPFIDRWIKDWMLRGGCGCEGCQSGYGDMKLLHPALEAMMPPGPIPMTSTQAAVPDPDNLPANTTGGCNRGGAVDSDLPMPSSASSSNAPASSSAAPATHRQGIGRGKGKTKPVSVSPEPRS